MHQRLARSLLILINKLLRVSQRCRKMISQRRAHNMMFGELTTAPEDLSKTTCERVLK